MLRKTTWMPYLTFGLISIILFSKCCYDCNTLYQTNWIYINETDYDISYNNSDKRFNVHAHDTISFMEERESITENLCEAIAPPSSCGYYPCVIQFNSTKCDTFDIQIGYQGIRDINRYECLKLKGRNFQYTYRYTQADYDKAKDCN